jgi:hypothetical protein
MCDSVAVVHVVRSGSRDTMSHLIQILVCLVQYYGIAVSPQAPREPPAPYSGKGMFAKETDCVCIIFSDHLMTLLQARKMNADLSCTSTRRRLAIEDSERRMRARQGCSRNRYNHRIPIMLEENERIRAGHRTPSKIRRHLIRLRLMIQVLGAPRFYSRLWQSRSDIYNVEAIIGQFSS